MRFKLILHLQTKKEKKKNQSKNQSKRSTRRRISKVVKARRNSAETMLGLVPLDITSKPSNETKKKLKEEKEPEE